MRHTVPFFMLMMVQFQITFCPSADPSGVVGEHEKSSCISQGDSSLPNSQSVAMPRASAGIGSLRSGNGGLPSEVYIRTLPPPFLIIFYILRDAAETMLFYKKVMQPEIKQKKKGDRHSPVSPLMIKKSYRPYPTFFAYDRMYDFPVPYRRFRQPRGQLGFPAMVHIHAEAILRRPRRQFSAG